MRAVAAACLFSLALAAQPLDPAENRLQTALLALEQPDAPRAELVEAIMRLARDDRRPAAASVVAFGDALANAVGGRPLPAPALTRIRQTIVALMRGEFASFTVTHRLREALLAAGADPKNVDLAGDRCLRIGIELRGPDDTPVKPVRLFQPRR